MSSQRRIDSSRANGAKSKGPKTPEGRRKSSLNALKHGLTAKDIALIVEDPEEFDALRATYLSELQPANQVELDLVDQIVAARWRVNRTIRTETAELDHELSRQEDEIRKTYDKIDDETRLAVAFRTLTDESHSLAILSRYEARYRRNYERGLRLLLELRTANLRPAQLAAAPKPAEPPPAPSLPVPDETSMIATPPAPDSPPSPSIPDPKIRMPSEPNPISEHPDPAPAGAAPDSPARHGLDVQVCRPACLSVSPDHARVPKLVGKPAGFAPHTTPNTHDRNARHRLIEAPRDIALQRSRQRGADLAAGGDIPLAAARRPATRSPWTAAPKRS